MQFWYDPSPERRIRTRRRRVRQRELNEQAVDATLADLSAFLSLDNPLYEVYIEQEPPRITPVEAPMNRTLKDYYRPTSAQAPGGFSNSSLECNNFELKPALISMVERNQFGGTALEDPHLHISNFLLYCNTMKHAGVTQDQLRHMLFPFSLRDRAKLWLNSLDPDSVSDWDLLLAEFYKKFYPPERTTTVRTQLTTFSQDKLESLNEGWERFKELQRQCPHNAIPKWLLVQSFHNGCNRDNRTILDSAANGRFMNQDVDAAYELIEEINP